MDGAKESLVYSLRFRLSLWLSFAIVMIAAIAGSYSFLSRLDEEHTQQDNQLRQTGYLISRLDAVPASPMARERAGDVDFEARMVVRFLPTDGGPPVPPAARSPFFSNRLSEGLQSVSVGAEEWRVFVRTNSKGVRVAVGQQTRVRDAAALASAVRTLIPILMLVPLLILLVDVLGRQMFKPLTLLSDQLRRRSEHDLGTLSDTDLPSEVRPFVKQINELLGRVGRSMSLQRRFIADAAHELRSPMTAMSLQAERLAAADMPAEARARLIALAAGLQRTRVMLVQLLDLAKSQEPSIHPRTKVSLQAVIREVLEDLVPIAEDKNIDLGVIGDVDAEVEASAVDLKILVKNLCDNAVRFTPAAGRVDIFVQCDNGLVTLQIDDTGPGIPPHERERVFDAFYRVLGNDEIGSGLGLAITRAIADTMSATIELDDARAPDSGLRVRVTFKPSC
jgi:two-component system OmpR family sensor kinase